MCPSSESISLLAADDLNVVAIFQDAGRCNPKRRAKCAREVGSIGKTGLVGRFCQRHSARDPFDGGFEPLPEEISLHRQTKLLFKDMAESAFGKMKECRNL